MDITITLLTDHEITFLRSLTFMPAIFSTGGIYGALSSSDPGSGLEFNEYKPFVSGDDLKWIDWHHYAGKKQLVLKTFHRHESLTYRVVVDLSASVITAGDQKVNRVKQLAAALAVVLLGHQCKVEIQLLGSSAVKSFSGNGHIRPVLDHITALESVANADLTELTFDKLPPEKSAIVLVSDMVSSKGIDILKSAMDIWQYRASFFSVSTPWERAPQLTGACTLIDAETGSELNLDIQNKQIADYIQTRNNYYTELTNYIVSRRWSYYDCCCDIPLVDFFATVFRAGKIVI